MASTDSVERLASIEGARILLVEDDEPSRHVATALLRDAGFSVDLAVNGRVAVARVGAATYDLVLMDLLMPVMDGETAAREIRKQARFDALPIVAMTDEAMQGDHERRLPAGMNAQVAKPIEPELLWDALLRWIAPRRSAALARPFDVQAIEADASLQIMEGLLLETVCAALDALLSADDADATELLSANADLLSAAFPEQYRRLDACVRSFDFEGALTVLRSVATIST